MKINRKPNPKTITVGSARYGSVVEYSGEIYLVARGYPGKGTSGYVTLVNLDSANVIDVPLAEKVLAVTDELVVED